MKYYFSIPIFFNTESIGGKNNFVVENGLLLKILSSIYNWWFPTVL